MSREKKNLSREYSIKQNENFDLAKGAELRLINVNTEGLKLQKRFCKNESFILFVIFQSERMPLYIASFFYFFLRVALDKKPYKSGKKIGESTKRNIMELGIFFHHNQAHRWGICLELRF